MNRSQYVRQLKEKAIQLVNCDAPEALSFFLSGLASYPETEKDSALLLGKDLVQCGLLKSKEQVVRFIRFSI